MSRLRRYLVPALLTAPVIFVCGKLLLQPQSTIIALLLRGDESTINIGVRYEHADATLLGWPWVYCRNIDVTGLSPADFGEPVLDFDGWLLLADMGVCMGIVSAVAGGLIWHRRRRGAWLRFSLAELFAIVTIVGVAFGWWAREHARWSRQQHLESIFLCFQPRTQYAGPEWLRRLWPEDDLGFLEQVASLQLIDFHADSTDKLLAALHAFPDVHKVFIGSGPGQYYGADEPSLDLLEQEHLLDRSVKTPSGERVREASFLWLDDLHAKIELLASFPHLQRLEFDTCTITAEDLATVAKVSTLEELSFCQDKVEAAGIVHLAKLAHLRKLDLRGAFAGDNSIDDLTDALKGLTALAELRLDNCSFTDLGLKRLVELPSLQRLIVETSRPISDETVRLLKDHIANVTLYAPLPALSPWP